MRARTAVSAVLLLVVLSACGASSTASVGSSTSGASPAGSLAAATAGAEASTSGSSPAGATAGAASSPGTLIDLAGLDVCSLLDEATVHELTGESVPFATDSRSDPSSVSCFWGAARPGVPAYVEISVFRSKGLSTYTFGAACTVIPVTGVGTEAKGATCPDNPQRKVWLVAFDRGVIVTLQVNEPSRPLEPGDLVATLQAVELQLK